MMHILNHKPQTCLQGESRVPAKTQAITGFCGARIDPGVGRFLKLGQNLSFKNVQRKELQRG